MHIDQALRLRPGQVVRWPEDRGQEAYSGRIDHKSDEVSETYDGKTKYIWVSVRHPRGHASVWPSNRLS
jgi:hypothetical protein